jgi:hypothetical protein
MERRTIRTLISLGMLIGLAIVVWLVVGLGT